MARKLMTAALILTLAFTAAGCGTKNAGASARNWVDGYDRTYEASGNSRYTADSQGRVQGYDTPGSDAANDIKNAGRDAVNDAKNAGRDAANAAKNAGQDAANGMKNAARSIGDATEDALDDMTNAAKKSSQQLTKNP